MAIKTVQVHELTGGKCLALAKYGTKWVHYVTLRLPIRVVRVKRKDFHAQVIDDPKIRVDLTALLLQKAHKWECTKGAGRIIDSSYDELWEDVLSPSAQK